MARAGQILNPKQLQFAAAARLADRPDGPTEIGFGGGRGGGKTHTMMTQIMIDDCQRYPGLKCLLLRKNSGSNLENFTEARKKILKKIRNKFNKFRNTLWFPNGESCVILGHFQNEKDIDKYLGLEYDVIAVEEATTLTRNKYNDIQTCCRTSKRGWRPRMYSTTNPGGIGHAWYRAKFIIPFKAGKETTTRFIPSLVGDNPWNNPDYVKILDKLTGWKRRAWFEGDWDIAAGQYFTNFRATSREAGGHLEDSFDPNKAKEWILALDHGFNHYTVILLGAVCDDGLHIVDEHCKRLTLTPQHVEMVKAMLDRQKIGVEVKRGLRLSDIRNFFAGTDIYASERDGKSVHDEYKANGIDWKPASTDRVNGWAELLKMFGDTENKIQPKLWIHSRCTRLIDCIPNLQHDPNNPEDVLKWDIDEDGNGGDDTCLIAGTLVACERGEIPIEQVEAGEKVLTRYGYREVLASGQTGRLKSVYKVELSDGTSLTGTGAHKILTVGGWTRIDELRFNHTVFKYGLNPLTVTPAFVRSVCAHGKADVYNLTVAEHPEFFANGILVHNCDALRYMVATKAKQTSIMKLSGF